MATFTMSLDRSDRMALKVMELEGGNWIVSLGEDIGINGVLVNEATYILPEKPTIRMIGPIDMTCDSIKPDPGIDRKKMTEMVIAIRDALACNDIEGAIDATFMALEAI